MHDWEDDNKFNNSATALLGDAGQPKEKKNDTGYFITNFSESVFRINEGQKADFTSNPVGLSDGIKTTRGKMLENFPELGEGSNVFASVETLGQLNAEALITNPEAKKPVEKPAEKPESEESWDVPTLIGKGLIYGLTTLKNGITFSEIAEDLPITRQNYKLQKGLEKYKAMYKNDPQASETQALRKEWKGIKDKKIELKNPKNMKVRGCIGFGIGAAIAAGGWAFVEKQLYDYRARNASKNQG